MQGSSGLIIGISIGVVIGILLAAFGLFCFSYQGKQLRIQNSSSRRAVMQPIRTNGLDACTILSDSTIGPESPRNADKNNSRSLWFEGFRKSNIIQGSGIPEYCYKDLQKATKNFTTLIGQGAFGPVYKAQMTTGETVAVKMLANDSKQGEREFQMEVKLLGRLHHRNLLNLAGYCVEKGSTMLIYVYMSNGSLASHLYGFMVLFGWKSGNWSIIEDVVRAMAGPGEERRMDQARSTNSARIGRRGSASGEARRRSKKKSSCRSHRTARRAHRARRTRLREKSYGILASSDATSISGEASAT